MKKVWLWLKRFWWVVVAGVGAALLFAMKVILSSERKKKEETKKQIEQRPSFTEFAKEEAKRAKNQIEIEHVKKKVETEAQKKVLENIEAEPDVEVQRRRLSKYLTNNL